MVDTFEREARAWLQELDEKIIGNPSAAYLIIKRVASGWEKIEDQMRRNSASGKGDITYQAF